MGLKKYKPTTPGQRFKLISSFKELTASAPEKSLLVPNKKTGGRNHSGKMTMRYIGGGHKESIASLILKEKRRYFCFCENY